MSVSLLGLSNPHHSDDELFDSRYLVMFLSCDLCVRLSTSACFTKEFKHRKFTPAINNYVEIGAN